MLIIDFTMYMWCMLVNLQNVVCFFYGSGAMGV